MSKLVKQITTKSILTLGNIHGFPHVRPCLLRQRIVTTYISFMECAIDINLNKYTLLEQLCRCRQAKEEAYAY